MILSHTLKLVIGGLFLAVFLIVAGFFMYVTPDRTTNDFYEKLGELTLQLSVIVIVGTMIKAIVDETSARRIREEEKHKTRVDFLRRVRAVHIAVEYARQLLNAHESAKTYGEQLRRMIQLRFEIREISADLDASSGLFSNQADIFEALKAIFDYLKSGGDEYVRCHGSVDADYKDEKSLRDTMKDKKMGWVTDLMESGKDYKKDYVPYLTKTKQLMRKDVFQN